MASVRIGSVVGYVLREEEIRPAIVVRVWSPEIVNLRVLTDGQNDSSFPGLPDSQSIWDTETIPWRTSVPYSEDLVVNSWHFLED